jgi:hypothetical protein
MLAFEAVAPRRRRTAPLADSVNWDPLFVAAGFERAPLYRRPRRAWLSVASGRELKSWSGHADPMRRP